MHYENAKYLKKIIFFMKLISKIRELYCLFPVPEEGTISKR